MPDSLDGEPIKGSCPSVYARCISCIPRCRPSLCIMLVALTAGCSERHRPATLHDFGVTPETESAQQPAPTALSDREDQHASVPVAIALDRNWIAQPADVASADLSEEGRLVLTADLRAADDYAELFFDLSCIQLESLTPNDDGTYDLRGMELIATVEADNGFLGSVRSANGVQLTIKDSEWTTLCGPWINATSAIEGPGMTVSMVVPDEAIGSRVKGVTVKFSLNSKAQHGFRGQLYLSSFYFRRQSTF